MKSCISVQGCFSALQNLLELRYLHKLFKNNQKLVNKALVFKKMCFFFFNLISVSWTFFKLELVLLWKWETSPTLYYEDLFTSCDSGAAHLANFWLINLKSKIILHFSANDFHTIFIKVTNQRSWMLRIFILEFWGCACEYPSIWILITAFGENVAQGFTLLCCITNNGIK